MRLEESQLRCTDRIYLRSLKDRRITMADLRNNQRVAKVGLTGKQWLLKILLSVFDKCHAFTYTCYFNTIKFSSQIFTLILNEVKINVKVSSCLKTFSSDVAQFHLKDII